MDYPLCQKSGFMCCHRQGNWKQYRSFKDFSSGIFLSIVQIRFHNSTYFPGYEPCTIVQVASLVWYVKWNPFWSQHRIGCLPEMTQSPRRFAQQGNETESCWESFIPIYFLTGAETALKLTSKQKAARVQRHYYQWVESFTCQLMGMNTSRQLIVFSLITASET